MPSRTLNDHAQELDGLIASAQNAAASGDASAMRAVHRALRAFIDRSDGDVPGVAELDSLAAQAMRDLTLARLGRAIDGDLASRDAEVVLLVKRLRRAAAPARAS